MFSPSNFTLKPVKADVCTSLSLVLWHIWISFQRKSFSLCYDAKSLIVESVESLLPNCGLKLVFTCSFSSVQYLIWFFTPFFSFGLLDYLIKRRAANHHLVCRFDFRSIIYAKSELLIRAEQTVCLFYPSQFWLNLCRFFTPNILHIKQGIYLYNKSQVFLFLSDKYHALQVKF